MPTYDDLRAELTGQFLKTDGWFTYYHPVMPGRAGIFVAGRYLLAEPVGEGRMGPVWRGYDPVLGRVVAVKEVLLPRQLPAAEHHELVIRTIREAHSAAQLNHPGVITIYEAVQHDGGLWIVMQFIPGRSLGGEITATGRLQWQRVAEIGKQIADALAYAHAAGIVHHDLKPGNVLLAGPRAIVTDFGIARVIDATSMATSPGGISGAPQYMAPERLERGEAGSAADLWALGATLYTAVEGIPPFHGPTPAAVIAAILTGTPRPPEHAGPLRELLDALLATDPFRRPDAQTVARALARQRSGPVTGSWTAASPGTARSGPPAAPGPTEEQAMPADTRSGRQAYPEQWYDDPRLDDMQRSRSGSPPAPDPRLEGIRYDELRYEEPSDDGPGYDEPIDDDSWYEQLRRRTPASALPRVRRRAMPEIITGEAPPESMSADAGPRPTESFGGFLGAPKAGLFPLTPVRPGHGLDGPEITSAWPAQPRADDEAESFEEFWAGDDDEAEDVGLFPRNDPERNRRHTTSPGAATRESAKTRRIPGRGRHRRRSVPREDPTAADGSQSGGPRVREGDLQGMPGTGQSRKHAAEVRAWRAGCPACAS